MRRRLLFVTPSSDNLLDPRGHPRGGRVRFSTPAILSDASCRAASRGTMRFTFSSLISIISSSNAKNRRIHWNKGVSRLRVHLNF